jgi:TonB family protein
MPERSSAATVRLAGSVAVAVLLAQAAGAQDAAPVRGGQAAAPQTIRLTAMGRPGGAMTIWEITAERAARQPNWDLRTAPPPRPISEAAASAIAWLRQRNQDIGPFELQNVMLTRARRGAAISFWYYQLDFVPVNGMQAGPPVRVVILPDGSIVEPRTEDPSDKPAPTPAQTAPPPGVYRSGGNVVPPRAIKEVGAQYTDEARRSKIQGTVLVELVVAADGSVANPRVVRSLDAGLDEQAIKAVRQWQFTPGSKDGQPVPVLVTVEMAFYLK